MRKSEVGKVSGVRFQVSELGGQISEDKDFGIRKSARPAVPNMSLFIWGVVDMQQSRS